MEEENQTPNPEQVNTTGSGKKKGLGPVGGLLIALLIVFLICVIGLLIRMVVEGDGDYFKPVKELFGIEEEEDDEESDSKTKKSSKSEEKEETKKEKNKGSTTFKGSPRYALLSDDTEGKDVKHYRLTIDMGEFFSKVMDELGTVSDDYDWDDEDYDYDWDDEDYDYDWDDEDYDYDWDDEDYDYDWDDDDYSYDENGLESMMGTAMMLLSEMGDMIDGEMYFDIYFEGNEIIQIVIGYDYADFLENFYEYMLEENEDGMEEQGIESVEDLAEMLVEEFEKVLDEDVLYDTLMDSAGDDAEAALKQFGIKEKDIKDAIDFNNEKGVIEVYINGTTKMKALISMALESEGFQESLKDMEKETKTKIDEDNIIESLLKAANDSYELDEYGFGFKFVEVK